MYLNAAIMRIHDRNFVYLVKCCWRPALKLAKNHPNT